MTTSPPAEDDPKQDNVSWREQAVARSLDTARTRAEDRVQRFMEAAQELISSGNGKDFTVQEFVERSGQSLRSFYQHFGGKHELLLALFEESILSTVDHLQREIADETDPLKRVHRFVIEYYRLCSPRSSASLPYDGVPPVMAEFAQRLLTERPKEAARAFIPLASMFKQLLDDAVAAGALRSGLPTRQVTGVVLEAAMFNAFSTTIAGTSSRDDDADRAEHLWDLFLHGAVCRPGG